MATLDALSAWGENNSGQLGDGTTVDQETPESITLPGGIGATAISAGTNFSLAIGSDGNIYAWGLDSSGQLGDGATVNQSTPELITLPGGVHATAVSAGDNHSLAIGSDGDIYAWGNNSFGQLGDGTGVNHLTPELISLPGGVTAKAVSAGELFSLAIGSNGDIYAWGVNSSGQLGDGTTNGQLTPEPIALPGGVTATAVSAGTDFSLAVGSDGNVYTWGDNTWGELGDGTGVGHLAPELIALPGGVTATAVSAGNDSALAVGSNGTVYAWGLNDYGQLGDGTTVNQSTPASITLPGGIGATAVSAGNQFSLAVGSDGDVYAWGDNTAGQLGDGTTDEQLTPEEITLPDGVTATAVSAGNLFSLAIPNLALAAPYFTAESPPLTATVGSSMDYTFSAAGYPLPTYSLSSEAPNWLTINPTSGTLSGTVPLGATTFSYSVSATNSVGSATAGPFTVTVPSTATVSGTVADSVGTPIADAVVDACETTGGMCNSTTTDSSGAFSVSAPGNVITLAAYPPQGLQLASASTSPIQVPAGGIQDQTLTLDGIAYSQNLLLNGSSSTQFISSLRPASADVTGCPNGLATVTLTGQDTATHSLTSNVVALSEIPPGSGSYAGVVPPQWPIDGPVEVQSSVSCPPQSAIIPSLGPSTGGTTVIVTGSGFTGATGVSFGGVPALSYSVVSDQGIEAVAPPGAGTVPVTVDNGGSSVVVDQYTYVAVQSVSPAGGSAAGGTWVVITGTGLLSATSVQFGLIGASFIQLSSTEIEALSPPGQGTQDITVTTLYGGTTPATDADKFSYGTATAGPDRPPQQAATVRLLQPSAGAAPNSDAASSSGHAPTATLSGASVAAAPAAVRLASLNAPLASGSESSLAVKILQFVYQQGPKVLGDANSLKTFINNYIKSLNPTCESNQETIADAISLAAGPAVDALAEAVLPYIESAEVSLLFETGPLALVVVYAVTPVAVNYLVGEISELLIKTAVTAYLGDCNEKTPAPPQPPPMPPPPGGAGGTGGSCSQGCNFAPNTLVDPGGTVLDTNDNPVSGATVTILRSDTSAGPFAAVDVTAPGIEPAVNPETTASDGTFQWEVDSGYYEVQATASGCTVPGDPAKSTATIGPYPVPPPQVGLTITVDCANEAPPPTPVVQSLSQSTGPPAGGTTVTVLGSGFTPSSTVTFGGTAAQAATYLSPEALTAISPPGNGVADVVVDTAGGGSATSAADQFFYGSPPTVTGLRPQSGSAAGGTTITISGTGFTPATVVGFGGLPASSFTVVSDTEIQATAPPEPDGTVDVQVVNPAGTSAVNPADEYTYVSAPAFTSAAGERVPWGSAFSFPVFTTGTPAPAIMLALGSTLPAGVTLTDNGNGTATLAGTSSVASGVYPITIQAANSVGDATQDFTLTVVPAAQSISFTAPATGVAGGSAALTATGGASGNPVVFSVGSSSGPGVCTVSGANGTTVNFTAAGTCVIDANQAGNADYTPAPQVSQTITVNQEPAFVLDSPPLTAVAGQTYSYTFAASGTPAPTYALTSGAPSWLSINASTGMLTGTPPSGTASFSYTVTVSNAVGAATAGPFTVTVTAASASADLTAALSCPASMTIGAIGTCTLTVANSGPATASKLAAAVLLPAALSEVSCTSGCVRHGSVFTWTLTSLASGASSKFAIAVKASKTGSALVLGIAASRTPDPHPLNNLSIQWISIKH